MPCRVCGLCRGFRLAAPGGVQYSGNAQRLAFLVCNLCLVVLYAQCAISRSRGGTVRDVAIVLYDGLDSKAPREVELLVRAAHWIN